MPQKKTSRRLVTPLLLFTLAGWALWALGRNAPEAPKSTGADAAGSFGRPETTTPRARATWSKRRLATSLAFATLFFGGAAFSAGAGDVVAEALEGDTTTEVTPTEEAPAEDAPAEEAPAEEAPAEETPAEEAPAEDEPADPDAPAEPEEPGEDGEAPAEEPGDDGDGEQPGDGEAPGDGDNPEPPPLPDDPGEADDPPPPPAPGVGEGSQPPPPSSLPVIDPSTRSPAHLDPEASADGFFATIWLHRPLPDPTPPAKRLDPSFARALAREAKAARMDWALVLGVLRARGFDGGSLSVATVRTTARQLVADGARRRPRAALRSYGGSEFAARAIALRNYNRAVGLRSLVIGFEAAKPHLRDLVLHDRRLTIYSGGRLDIAMGRTDVRVLVLLRYLAEAHGQVTVSSLTTGHGIFSRPGVVSAHTYGLAVDIAALHHRSIYGNQEPGGLTERAVRNILLLPSELQPKQVISLLGLGGPSFPLADHGDHIHVGY